MSDSDWDWYTSEAQSIRDSYPIDDTKVFTSQFQTWADESLQVSKDDVYNGKSHHLNWTRFNFDSIGFVEGEVPDQ